MATDASFTEPGSVGESVSEIGLRTGWVPVRCREVVAAVAWTIFADLLIFRTLGYAGPAVFFLTAPMILWWASPKVFSGRSGKFLAAAMLIVVARLFWLGGPLAIFSACAIVVGFSMIGAGGVPLVLEGLHLATRLIYDGARRVGEYRLPRRIHRTAASHQVIVAIAFPIFAAVVFGSIFVFANPDLLDFVTGRLSQWTTAIAEWFQGMSLWELPFLVLALFVGVGLMRPALPLLRLGQVGSAAEVPPGIADSAWYSAFRNTLVTLIVMFSVYLIFEFTTLFNRDFPAGFYYAGYAHQGAAWLTFALALATGLLSLMFRSSMLRDHRLVKLKKLAWVWSGLNGLLAVAVYNRLMIYVGYNGMTSMRTVGFFGMTLVVVGFGLVVYKIATDRSFWWLIRSQLVAFLLTVMLYSVFPVDYIAHRYNAWQINRGNVRPAVMIAVKPISDEGYFALLELTDHEDPTIREGVQAMLARRQTHMLHASVRRSGASVKDRQATGWTQFQASDYLLESKLQNHQAEWSDFQQPNKRNRAIERFRRYAMQWY